MRLDLPSNEIISEQIARALTSAKPATNESYVDSPDFCMDDLKFHKDLGPIQMVAKILSMLKGKKIENVEWVTRFNPEMGNHFACFRIKIS